jgi:serine/threonine-protein kinase
VAAHDETQRLRQETAEAPTQAPPAGDGPVVAPTTHRAVQQRDDVSPLPPTIGGKYRPIRLIARGGMGAVYEVIHVNTGQHLALKLMLARSLLAPDLVERFRREARIAGTVNSPHVVRVIDADVAPEIDGAPFLVMELLPGSDLEAICCARQPEIGEALDWLRQLAVALDTAHGEGIVHRDLKPENVFLAERVGEPAIIKILDFGVAKLASEAGSGATATGQILGTPRYMAPEQAIGAKEVTASADRFSLGLIAFRLLVGRHYFTGDNWVALLRDVGRGPASPPSARGSRHGRAFDVWFSRACASDPRARFSTAAEQVEALAAAVAGKAVPRVRRTPIVVAVAASGACALGLASWLHVHHGSREARAAAAQPAALPVPVEKAEGPIVVRAPVPANPTPTVTVQDGDARPRRSVPPRSKRGRPTSPAKAAVDSPAVAPRNPPHASDRVWDEP